MVNMIDPLVIPKDVRLVPVAELPPQVRDQLDWSEGDVAITRVRSRTPSKVVNADFAALFNEFQQEKTIVEAVMHYSARASADPRETLELAFPLLQQFVGYGLLVPPARSDQGADRPLQRGEQVDAFTVVRRIRTLQDTEIYQARSDDGQTVALKIRQPEAQPLTDHVLRHEADVLRDLDGLGVPRLIGQGRWGERPYLAIAWCSGVEITRVAAEVRTRRDRLLTLCTDVLQVYAHLHARGVMHGDIHPGNILVDGDGRVTLIDFGLAHQVHRPAPYRGGVIFYYEPEYATAFLGKQRPPDAHPAGEQYALAALVYQLITGMPYLNFSLEEDILYDQIINETPRPMSEHGLQPWPEVETVLARALAKDPSERFADVTAFRDALQAVAGPAALRDLPSPDGPSTPHPLVHHVLDQLTLDGALLRDGLPRSPYASVNYGTAGVAYALYRLACERDDPELLALADVWLTRAEQVMGEEAGFYNADLQMDAEAIGRISPYHTPSGLCAVRFLIARAQGDVHAQTEALAGFVAIGSQPCDTLDVTLGKAGVVLIGAMLYEALMEREWAEQSGLLDLGTRLSRELWETLGGYGPIGSGTELRNLGLAHGWAGLLYATLRWHEATGAPLPPSLPARLAELAGCAEESGRGVRWPWETGGPEETSMPGWCNGSAGHVYLWARAYRVFGEDRYLGLALRSGWNAWEETATLGTLCCGLAGRSYSLLHLYRLTKADAWLERARALADQAAHSIRHAQTPEYEGFEMSLYKGELGVALLLADLEQPDQAVFPFLESEFSTPM